MEQATDGAETAVIDGLVSIRIDSVMRPRSSSRGGAIQMPQLQLRL